MSSLFWPVIYIILQYEVIIIPFTFNFTVTFLEIVTCLVVYFSKLLCSTSVLNPFTCERVWRLPSYLATSVRPPVKPSSLIWLLLMSSPRFVNVMIVERNRPHEWNTVRTLRCGIYVISRLGIVLRYYFSYFESNNSVEEIPGYRSFRSRP